MAIQYRPDIDGLRAVAVVPVVINHAIPDAVPGGFVGVDIFFVISGFLITSIIARDARAGTFSYWEFYSRRARRILPALLAMMASVTVVAWLLFFPVELVSHWNAMFWSALFAANVFFLLEIDYFSAPLDSYPLLHLWSLAVEEQFYILMPVVVLMVVRWAPRRLTLVIAVLCTISFIGSILMVDFHQKTAFYLTPFRFWELGLGALAALAGPFRLRPELHEAAGVLGLALLAGSFALISETSSFPGLGALAPCVGTTLLIAAGPQTWASRLLSLHPVVWIGRISYSLYLWHWPVLVFSSYFLLRTPTGPESAALIGVSVLLAVLSLHFVERPFRSHAMTAVQPRKTVAIAAAALGLFCAAGLGGITLGGADWRLKPAAVAAGIDANQRAFADASPCRETSIGEIRLCRIGSADAPLDFIAWGDSHAYALTPGFELAAAKAGLNGIVTFKPACPPLPHLNRADLPYWHGCAAYNAQILDLIARYRPRTVLLSARWSLTSTGEGFGQERKHGIYYTATEPDIVDGVGQEVISTGLVRAIAAVRARGAEPVVVLPIPEIGWDVGRLVARATQWGLTLPLSPTRAHYDERQLSARSAIMTAASQEGARILDPAAILCDPQVCSALGAEGPLYWDDNHLNGRGARLLTDAFVALMAPQP